MQRITLKNVPEQNIKLGNSYIIAERDVYSGPYAATPSNTIQVFPTLGKTMIENFTVDPIPSNYGLITYNGFELIVS